VSQAIQSTTSSPGYSCGHQGFTFHGGYAMKTIAVTTFVAPCARSRLTMYRYMAR
jgi:hypothetical protein